MIVVQFDLRFVVVSGEQEEDRISQKLNMRQSCNVALKKFTLILYLGMITDFKYLKGCLMKEGIENFKGGFAYIWNRLPQ